MVEKLKLQRTYCILANYLCPVPVVQLKDVHKHCNSQQQNQYGKIIATFVLIVDWWAGVSPLNTSISVLVVS